MSEWWVYAIAWYDTSTTSGIAFDSTRRLEMGLHGMGIILASRHDHQKVRGYRALRHRLRFHPP